MPTDEEATSEARLRLQAQLALIVRAHPDEEFAVYMERDDGVESQDLDDFKFLYDPTTFLARNDRRVDVNDALARDFIVVEEPDPDADPDLAAVDLVRFPLPSRRRDGERPRVLDALQSLDEQFGIPDEIDPDNPDDLGRMVAEPDHWLHVCLIGNGRICPAVEPKVTDETDPWPPRATDLTLGHGVRVSVVDSGWHPPAADDADTPWMEGVDGDPEHNDGLTVEQYAGHGTFVAGVVKCFAPDAVVRVEGFLGPSGAIRESKMVTQLSQALALQTPDIINLSAGTTTRKNRPLLSFERFFNKRLDPLGRPCVMVAAAGNEGVSAKFWPASFPWALGVGSLDRNGGVSDFSNFGNSAEIYAVGRDIVNAFPTGTYTTREPPYPVQTRVFTNGLAQWSGTSFSAPMVAGMIAAEMSLNGGDVLAARETVKGLAKQAAGPEQITVWALPLPS